MLSSIVGWLSRKTRPALTEWPEPGRPIFTGQDALRLPLSTDAIAVLRQTARVARRLKHEYIATEHLLCGIAESGVGVSQHVLAGLGITGKRLQREVDRITQPGDFWELQVDEPLPLTPRAKQAIQSAVEEARFAGAPAVTADHLFVGLLHEPEGVAYQIFENLAFKPIDVRDCVLGMMWARRNLLPEAAPCTNDSRTVPGR